MNPNPIPHASTPSPHEGNPPPRTWGGIALYAASVALVPLTLFALAHPTVVAAGAIGTAVGLLARPALRWLTRRPDRRRSSSTERPSRTGGRAATND